MVAYHVHEKAILTAIIPMTLLATSSRRATRLYLRTCTFGLFGLLPLLFRPEELLLKVVLFMAWMCGAIYILDVENGGTSTTCSISRSCSVGQAGQEEEEEEELTRRMTSSTPSSLLTKFDLISFVTLGSVLVFMEIIHPIVFLPSGRLEFLPLMATSVICAAGLIWCWLESYRQMRYHHSRAR